MKEMYLIVFFLRAENGIRDSIASRGLGDVYKRQEEDRILSLSRPYTR